MFSDFFSVAINIGQAAARLDYPFTVVPNGYC